MCRRYLIRFALILALADFSASDLRAQTTTSGGLTGVVADPSGAVVPNVNVKIKNNANGSTQSAMTDREGVYQFFFLAPGRYTMTIARDGFQEQRRVVNVLLGPSVTVNVALEIAKEHTTVRVTGEAPLIHATNGDVSTTMNQKQISEVPNPGNDLTYIAQTAPGTIMNTDMLGGANFSILGMPGDSYRYTVDGLSDTDNLYHFQYVGALFLLLGQNQIQEASVVSTGYSGQFGGAAGGNITYTTKSGGDQFHGNAQYYWNGRVLNANDWFNNEFQTPRPFDIANQWAGSLGGPIWKDKLFFFFDTEGLHVLIPQNFLILIPSTQFETATINNIDAKFGSGSASDAFYRGIFRLYDAAPGANPVISGGLSAPDPTGCTGFTSLGAGVPCARYFFATRGRPSQDALTAGRVDWNAGSHDRVFVRLQYDHGHGSLYTDPISPLFDINLNLSWWQGQVVETHTFGSSAASQFLLAGSSAAYLYGPKSASQTLAAFPTVLSFFAPGTFTTLGGQDNLYAPRSGVRPTQYQLSEDLVKTRGSHEFGFGVSFERTDSTLLAYTSNAVGTLMPQSLDAFYQGGLDTASPNADFTQLSQSFPSALSQRLAFYTLGLYGQENWHARPDLSLTLSLRAEHTSNPVCPRRCFARLAGPFESISHDPSQPYKQAILTNQRQALPATDSIQWSPRFSFAWQPFGVSHSAVLRGGAGVFYSPLPGALAVFLSSNSPILNSFTILHGNLTPHETNSLFTQALASNAAFLSGFAARETLAQIQAADTNFSPPSITTPDGRMRTPQFQRWNLEFQQTFSADTSFSIGYFGHHGIHELVENPSANAFGFGSLPAGLCSSPPVPPCADARFSKVTEISSTAVSNYNGMVVSFQRRISLWGNGLFQVNYTYGHAFDEASNGGLFPFTFGSSLFPQDPRNLRGAYGPAEYDVRHSLNANYVWELPLKKALRGHGPESLVEGWQVSGTIFARTGYPYTVFDAVMSNQLAQNNYFGLLYSVPIGPFPPGAPCGEGAAFPLAPRPCQPPEVLTNGNPNPAALFVQSGCESGFNAGNLPGPSGPCSGRTVTFTQGRNRFRYPSYFNTDFAVMKNTKIPSLENAELGISFQFFNFFNHPNFGGPDIFSSDSTFGQIFNLEQPPTSILGNGFGGDAAPRMIQLKVQLRF